MTPDEYDAVVRFFAEVCELPAEQRSQWLDQACRDCPHLRPEVEAMLAQDELAGKGARQQQTEETDE